MTLSQVSSAFILAICLNIISLPHVQLYTPTFHMPRACLYGGKTAWYRGFYEVRVKSQETVLYEDYVDCELHIIVSRDHGVNITFEFIDLEPADSTGCQDYVQFYDTRVSTATRLSVRYCGNRVPDPIIALNQHVVIQFVSNSDTRRRGFAVDYFRIPPLKLIDYKKSTKIPLTDAEKELDRIRYGTNSGLKQTEMGLMTLGLLFLPVLASRIFTLHYT